MISIIIATFNSEKTIRTALSSVLNQKYQNWECLVIDGASKDNTINIIKEFVTKDKRIHYISEPDKGIYDAFNKGWKLAKGEWIYYLGSDDLLLSEGLENLIKETNTNFYDVIYGNVIRKSPNGTIMKSKTCGHKSLPYQMLACHQGIITKKTLIQELNGFDSNIKAYADKDLYIRSILKKGKIRFLYKNVDVALFTSGGASEINLDKFKEEIYIYKKNHLPFKYILFQLLKNIWLYTKKYYA